MTVKKANALISLLISISSVAQIHIVPLPGHYNNLSTSSGNLRVGAHGITLPFWDDFSRVRYQPDTNLWINSNHVFITDGLAFAPLSFGVATFDGLDGNGIPHNNDPNEINFGDSIVSRPIDLSVLLPSQQNSVFLSFAYQKGGAGEPPDANDFIEVQFKTQGGDWVTAWPSSPDVLEPSNLFFTQVMIQVVDSLHFDGFQFRFRSFGRLTGPFDTWNLDYVYLDKGRSNGDFDILDRAITRVPTSLFKGFTAIPMSQFLLNPADHLDSTFSEVINLETSQPVQGIEYSTLLINTETEMVIDTLVDKNPLIINSNQRLTIGAPKPDVTKLTNQSSGLEDSLFLELLFFVDTGDTLLIERIDPVTMDTTFYPNVDLRVNDTISRSFTIHNYFAFDDGSAEFGAGINQSGGQLAYQFNLQGQDTLVAIDMYFPNIGGIVAGTPIEIFVLDTLENSQQTTLFNKSFTVQASTGINQFQTYPIDPPVIVSDSFYIGFKQTTEDFIPVGLDKNTDSGERIYFNVGAWEQNQDVPGSLMIRPVFGTGIITGLDKPILVNDLVRFYPNPVTDVLNLTGFFDQLRVLGLLGRVHISGSGFHDTSKINMSSLPNGLYLLEFRRKNKIQISKIIKH